MITSLCQQNNLIISVGFSLTFYCFNQFYYTPLSNKLQPKALFLQHTSLNNKTENLLISFISLFKQLPQTLATVAENHLQTQFKAAVLVFKALMIWGHIYLEGWHAPKAACALRSMFEDMFSGPSLKNAWLKAIGAGLISGVPICMEYNPLQNSCGSTMTGA